MSQKAILLSFITCDGVHFDNASGKYYLLGVFSGIRAAQFPVKHPCMYWFLTLTEVAEGTHKVNISMYLESDQPRTICKRAFKSRGPLERIHIVNEVKNLEFPDAGDYSILIEVDDEPLLATSFQVSEHTSPSS